MASPDDGPDGAGAVVGFDENVEIIDFYRLFQLAPTYDEFGTSAGFNLPVEVVERIAPRDIGPYREVVQLFR